MSTMIYVFAAYLMWGFFPAFFPLLLPATPLEILAHRIVWTAVLVGALLFYTGAWREIKGFDRRTWAWLAAASVAISANWGIYVVTVNSNHVGEAALGYFINPLVAVALGIAFLGEKLRKVQVLAVAVAAVAVIWLTVATGTVPYMALGLAFSFGIYGLLKKQVRVSAAVSVAVEAAIVSPLALGYIIYLTAQGTSTFHTEGPVHVMLLVGCGVVTALPLLCFSRGAKSVPLSTVGMMQYMTPTMQMLWALFVNNEHFSTERWIGFIIIWIAVAIYLTDMAGQAAKTRRRRARLHHVTDVEPTNGA